MLSLWICDERWAFPWELRAEVCIKMVFLHLPIKVALELMLPQTFSLSLHFFMGTYSLSSLSWFWACNSQIQSILLPAQACWCFRVGEWWLVCCSLFVVVAACEFINTVHVITVWIKKKSGIYVLIKVLIWELGRIGHSIIILNLIYLDLIK